MNNFLISILLGLAILAMQPVYADEASVLEQFKTLVSRIESLDGRVKALEAYNEALEKAVAAKAEDPYWPDSSVKYEHLQAAKAAAATTGF